MRHGFTLVELSIVLVIIGLLIGGILVAQSMITTTKITTTVSLLSQFDAGVNNFMTKYSSFPGDSKFFSGNGDRLIDGPLYGEDNFTCEANNFWANTYPELYKGYTCSTSFPNPDALAPKINDPNKTVPAAKIGKSGSFFAPSALDDGSGHVDANSPNYYMILSSDQGVFDGTDYQYTGTTSSNSAVKPADLLALDAKMDDGNGNTGNVRSGGIDSGTDSPMLAPLATCSDGSGKYIASNNSYECTPFIRIGTMAGNTQ